MKTEFKPCSTFLNANCYPSLQVVEQLGLGRPAARPGAPGAAGGSAPAPPSAARRFLLPLGECEFMLNSVLEELQRDAHPVPSGNRPARCTGTALMVRCDAGLVM